MRLLDRLNAKCEKIFDTVERYGYLLGVIGMLLIIAVTLWGLYVTSMDY